MVLGFEVRVSYLRGRSFNHISGPFATVALEIRLALAQVVLDHDLPRHCDDKHVPPCPAFFLLRWGLPNFFATVDPELWSFQSKLPVAWDYRCVPLCPTADWVRVSRTPCPRWPQPTSCQISASQVGLQVWTTSAQILCNSGIHHVLGQSESKHIAI
jgi:hypothetical protein